MIRMAFGMWNCIAILPAYGVWDLRTNPEDLKEACKRHLEFFNTTPQCITLPLGITVAMEEQRANDMENFDTTSISSVKTAIMGPLAGIGELNFLMFPLQNHSRILDFLIQTKILPVSAGSYLPGKKIFLCFLTWQTPRWILFKVMEKIQKICLRDYRRLFR